MGQIGHEELDVLGRSRIEGNVLFLPEGQLDRKLYQRVNAVLEALGGKWNRKLKGHVFPSDPTERLAGAIEDESYERQADFGFFPTPRAVADQVVQLAGLEAGMSVLEPSAGTGALVEAIRCRAKVELVCVELQEANFAALYAKYRTGDLRLERRERGSVRIACRDFLDCSPKLFGVFDRVVMNPPFSNKADVDHVRHAFKFLKPGGRLVSVMSAGVLFRQDKKTKAFREELKPTFVPLPALSFRESGTSVNTTIAIIDKAK